MCRGSQDNSLPGKSLVQALTPNSLGLPLKTCRMSLLVDKHTTVKVTEEARVAREPKKL